MLAIVKPFSINYYVSNILNIVSFCSVDIFVIISGFMSKKRFSISRLFVLWLTALFYSIIITIVFAVLGNHVSTVEIIKSFFPIIFNRYWSLSSYIGMSLFAPFCNMIVDKLSKRQIVYAFLIVIILSIFSCINSDLFGIDGGDSMLWFIIMYSFGCILKKIYIEKWIFFNRKKLLILVVILLCMLFLSKFVIEILTNSILGMPKGGNTLIKYSSPIIMLISGCIVLLSSGHYSKLHKVIDFFVPSIFAAYLIQDNVLVRKYFVTNAYTNLSSMNPLILAVLSLSMAVLTLIVCLIIDIPRNLLFRKINLRSKLDNVEKHIKIWLGNYIENYKN